MTSSAVQGDKARRPAGTGSILRRTGSRSYQMQYVDLAGKRHRESCHTTNVKVARDLLRDRLVQVRTGKFFGLHVEHTTVEELIEGLLRDYRINARRSCDDVEIRWRKHLRPFFGQLKAVQVTPAKLREYVDLRLKQHAARASINRELAALKRAFNLGLGEKVAVVPKFPHLDERDNVRTGFIDSSQHDALALACSELGGLSFRALFETAYCLGWRLEELLWLRVAQVDLAAKVLRLEPGMTKSGKGREAPLTENLLLWLQQCVVDKFPDDFVFERDMGRPYRDIRFLWREACCKAGLGRMLCPQCHEKAELAPDASAKTQAEKYQRRCPTCSRTWMPNELKYKGLLFHDLRRSAVRGLIRDGVSEKVAMTITGHCTRSVFDRYDIVSAKDVESAREKMNKADRVKSEAHTLAHTREREADDRAEQPN